MDPRRVFNQDETAVEVCLGIFFLILKYMYIIGWVPVTKSSGRSEHQDSVQCIWGEQRAHHNILPLWC
jgi:hypothetical protein